MRAANCFIFAASIAILLVHFDCHCAACFDWAFACYAFGAADIAADVIGGYALHEKYNVSLHEVGQKGNMMNTNRDWGVGGIIRSG